VEVLALALVLEKVTPVLWTRRRVVGRLGTSQLTKENKEVAKKEIEQNLVALVEKLSGNISASHRYLYLYSRFAGVFVQAEPR
jgi:type 1 glutamine amidotransferase